MNNHNYIGMFSTALRWVAGWTYFSAFWRRLVLENKLDPEASGYIGEKFNHFLPHALGIKPLIEYLVSNPESLWWAMLSFTIIEGIVGLLFILGVFTRLMSLSVLLLAFGILLGSGWLGTTCLDEWQIGVLGVASGFTIFLSGGGIYSLDQYLINNNNNIAKSKWFGLLGSGKLPLKEHIVKRICLYGSILIVALTLFTNQYFHGGVYGKLHNLSVKPHVSIQQAIINDNKLDITIMRDEGADVYGSFLINIKVINDQGETIYLQDQNQLASMKERQIKNDYVAKIKPGKHSLILPLGARATLNFEDDIFKDLNGNYYVVLTDISGIEWKEKININHTNN